MLLHNLLYPIPAKTYKSLSQLCSFLVEHIEMSEKTDDVINEISDGFSIISNADKLI